VRIKFANPGNVWLIERNLYQFLELVNSKFFSYDSRSQTRFESESINIMLRLVFSEISFTENFISSHKNVQLLYVYPTFALQRCSILFSWFPNLQLWQTKVTLFRSFKHKLFLHFHLPSAQTSQLYLFLYRNLNFLSLISFSNVNINGCYSYITK